MSVTADSTTCGLAPGSAVLTETMGGSTSGNSRTASWVYPMAPKSTSARLSMLASTGRRIERTEIFMRPVQVLHSSGRLGDDENRHPVKKPLHYGGTRSRIQRRK